MLVRGYRTDIGGVVELVLPLPGLDVSSALAGILTPSLFSITSTDF